jgi:hypothetical protein
LFFHRVHIQHFLRMAILTCAACGCAPEQPVEAYYGHLICWDCLEWWTLHERDGNRRVLRIRCPGCMGDVEPDRNTVVLVLGAEDDSARPATKQPSAGLVFSTRAHPLSPLASPQPVRNSEPPQRARASNFDIWLVLVHGLLMSVTGVLIPACFVIAVIGGLPWTVTLPMLFAVVFRVLLG